MEQSYFLDCIKQDRLDLFIKHKDKIIENKIDLIILIETCVYENKRDFFDYMINNFEFDWAYDDSVLFNYSFELKNFDFAQTISQIKGIEVNNDDNWCLRYAVNNSKMEEINFLLSFPEIISTIDKNWVKEHLYVNEEYILKRISTYNNTNRIKDF